jgi:hypothetical protein
MGSLRRRAMRGLLELTILEYVSIIIAGQGEATDMGILDGKVPIDAG